MKTKTYTLRSDSSGCKIQDSIDGFLRTHKQKMEKMKKM